MQCKIDNNSAERILQNQFMKPVFKIKLLFHTDNTVNCDKVENKSTCSLIISFSRHFVLQKNL